MSNNNVDLIMTVGGLLGLKCIKHNCGAQFVVCQCLNMCKQMEERNLYKLTITTAARLLQHLRKVFF